MIALPFARFMRALMRDALPDQRLLELPYRTVRRPSETVILDALHDLNVRRQRKDILTWYPWVAVLPYKRRLLDALEVPTVRTFVLDPFG